MNFFRKLFLPVVALVVLLNVFSINTFSAKAAAPEIENTYSQLSGDDIVPTIDGTLSQQDEVTPFLAINYVVEWKTLSNYSVIPKTSYDYDHVFKLYYRIPISFTDSEVNISTITDRLLGKYRKQTYRTYKF